MENQVLNLALIGAGQLGSRHLQSLKTLPYKTTIHVFDPLADSLEVAKSRFDEIDDKDSQVQSITFNKSFDQIPKNNFDWVIIATSANVRHKVVKDFINIHQVANCILEKVAFQSNDQFSDIDTFLDMNNVNAWVNCPRRYWNIYQKLRNNIKDSKFVSLEVTGKDWGLACNGIHFIDLYSFLTNTTDLTIDMNHLDSGFENSKREGFIELTGTIRGSSPKGQFCISSRKKGSIPLILQLTTEDSIYIINEIQQKIIIFNGDSWTEETFSAPFQSQLTKKYIEDFYNDKEIMLPTFKVSQEIHEPFLDGITNHLQKFDTAQDGICPIT